MTRTPSLINLYLGSSEPSYQLGLDLDLPHPWPADPSFSKEYYVRLARISLPLLLINFLLVIFHPLTSLTLLIGSEFLAPFYTGVSLPQLQ